MLMSNRQKKMYQEVEKTQKKKNLAAKKLVEKKRNIDKRNQLKWTHYSLTLIKVL